MKVFKIDFRVKNEKDEELELAVNSPNLEQKREGKKIWNRTFKDALDSGAFLRQQLDTEVEKRNLWDDDKKAQLKSLNEQLQKDVDICEKGGVKLSEAKDAALRVRINRLLIQNLMSDITSLISKSAESQADDAEFDYLVSTCTVYNTDGSKYFSGLEDYLEKKSELPSFMAAQNLAKLVYNYSPDFEKELPENKFLLKYKFVDENLTLIEDAKEEEKPEESKDEFKPFLDEEGNPVE